MNTAFQEKVFEYVQEPNRSYRPLARVELAPGVIAITDAEGGCNGYFDLRLWQFSDARLRKNMKRWDDDNPDLPEGIGTIPRTNTIEEMSKWTQRKMVPLVADIVWHDNPLYIPELL